MAKQCPTDDALSLIGAVARGDKQAFRLLYEQTYGRIYRYIRTFVGDDMLAEDIVVQTYAIAWQQAAKFKGASRLSTWMIGIARNIAYKEFRKRKITEPFEEAFQGSDAESQFQPEQRNRNELMQHAVHKLSAHHREIIELVFYQDLTYPEIAELLGIPVNTVKTRVFHAKSNLKTILATQGITSDDF